MHFAYWRPAFFGFQANRFFRHAVARRKNAIRYSLSENTLITCYLRYVIDPFKLKEFETYGKMWIPLVEKFGGKHHGYFMPHEGANNIALALFSFPSLAAYETYRTQAANDPECQAAMRYYQETKCFISYERSFMRPVFE
ncbi:NIPSNAP family protein [Sulfuriferula sp. GW1]|uniref:NIPSNAP family protein n=1 Tax=Sulfuriferula sp. GW1 TaxID=3345111 RepID=UPI0039B0762E